MAGELAGPSRACLPPRGRRRKAWQPGRLPLRWHPELAGVVLCPPPTNRWRRCAGRWAPSRCGAGRRRRCAARWPCSAAPVGQSLAPTPQRKCGAAFMASCASRCCERWMTWAACWWPRHSLRSPALWARCCCCGTPGSMCACALKARVLSARWVNGRNPGSQRLRFGGEGTRQGSQGIPAQRVSRFRAASSSRQPSHMAACGLHVAAARRPAARFERSRRAACSRSGDALWEFAGSKHDRQLLAAMGQYLATPVEEKESMAGSTERLHFGITAMQGWRRTMVRIRAGGRRMARVGARTGSRPAPPSLPRPLETLACLSALQGPTRKRELQRRCAAPAAAAAARRLPPTCLPALHPHPARQEDAHIAEHVSDEVHIFGVFDGHGGPEVARFCSKRMPDELRRQAAFQGGRYEDSLKEVGPGLGARACSTASSGGAAGAGACGLAGRPSWGSCRAPAAAGFPGSAAGISRLCRRSRQHPPAHPTCTGVPPNG